MRRVASLPGGRELAAVVAGLAQAASIAVPVWGEPSWLLQVLSLSALFALVDAAGSIRRAALLGWLFAIAWLCGTFWWLYISMHVYGGLASPLAALAVLALAAFLGSYYGVAAGLYRWLRPEAGWRAALVFACAWLVAELMRAEWFTGFPWGAGGYAHVDGPLRGLAPWMGVYGIGFAASALVALTVRWLRGSGGRWTVIAAWLLAGATVLLPTVGTPAGSPLGVTLLQGNIPQDEKFEGRTGVPLALGWYGEQLQKARTPLVVAPETAIPLLPQQLPEDYLQKLSGHFIQGRQAALVGMPLGSFQQGYTNSVVGFKPGADAYRFDKHHLVPFG